MVTFQVEALDHSETHVSFRGCLAFHFFDKSKEICSVIIAPICDNEFETHISDIPEEFLNKGMGVEVYTLVFKHCISNNIQLRSSNNPSIEASRLWLSKRLRESFYISTQNGRYKLEGLK